KAAVHQISRQIRNDTVGKRIRVTEIAPGRVETEIFGRNLGGTPEAMEEAWQTFYEGYESLTTEDIVSAIDFALAAPRRANVGLIEVMPTFQVPGGLTFDRREARTPAPRLRRPPRSRTSPRRSRGRLHRHCRHWASTVRPPSTKPRDGAAHSTRASSRST